MSKKFTLGANKESAVQLLPEGEIKVVQVGSTKICLVRKSEEIFAFQHLCPHQSAPLHEGKINAFGQVICPLHHYRFDLRTGDVKSGSCPELKIYPAKLTGDGIEINV